MAGSGGRWTAETRSQAVPRGRGRRPCWAVRAALVRAGWTVGQVCRSRSHRLPLVTSLYCVWPPLQPTRAFCGPLACRSHWVPQRDRLSQRNCWPPELPAGAGPSAVLRPDVTLEFGGWGEPWLCGSPAVGEGCRSVCALELRPDPAALSLEPCDRWGPPY